VHLALAELPRFEGVEEGMLRGTITIAPSVEYVERAYDDAKYGRVSQHPVLEMVIPTLADPALAPAGRHVMSVMVQYVPYRLEAGVWDSARREALAEAVVQRLAEYAPNLPRVVVGRQVLAPPDLEERLGLTAGDVFHGQPALDQTWFMRPLPGWARYRLPVPGLYLGGAGAHPGGGVTAGPGYGVARAVLADLRRR
jgi:phytoene dehydrogenase-like protein